MFNKLICKWFGHRPAYGYGRIEGAGYFRIRPGEKDGMGVVHADIISDCERCGYQNYRVGRIHLPKATHSSK
jgi:hypothetical protein